jgi:hypothetical protein
MQRTQMLHCALRKCTPAAEERSGENEGVSQDAHDEVESRSRPAPTSTGTIG